jgi:hypothetical protein
MQNIMIVKYVKRALRCKDIPAYLSGKKDDWW